jgi:predicted DNA-binding protein
MFQLKKGYDEYSNKTFRLPVRIVDRLEKLSAEYNLSVNKIVIQCIEYALNNMDTKENNFCNDEENKTKE